MKKLFTKTQEKRIIKIYLDNNTLEEVCNKFNCNSESIRNVLIRNKIPRRKAAIRPNKPFDLQKVKDYFIADMLGDGHISKPYHNHPNSRLTFTFKYKEFAEYIANRYRKIGIYM